MYYNRKNVWYIADGMENILNSTNERPRYYEILAAWTIVGPADPSPWIISPSLMNSLSNRHLLAHARYSSQKSMSEDSFYRLVAAPEGQKDGFHPVK